MRLYESKRQASEDKPPPATKSACYHYCKKLKITTEGCGLRKETFKIANQCYRKSWKANSRVVTDTEMVLLNLIVCKYKQLKEQPRRSGAVQPLCTHETSQPGIPSRTRSPNEEKLLRVESK